VPDPVEVYRDARAYKGGGSTDIWYRWGNVYHPGGYDWAGQTTVFPSDAHYGYVYDTAGTTGGTPASTDVHTAGAIAAGMPQLLTDVSSVTATLKGTWTRKASSALSLGILPVFHS
jgi:hypothetical protein